MNQSLKAKVIIGSVLFLSLLVISGVYSVNTLSKLNQSMEELYKKNMVSLEKILQADRDMYQAQVAERSILVATDADYAYWEKFHKDNIGQAIKRAGVVSEHTDPKVVASHKKFLSDLDAWSKDSYQLFAEAKSADSEKRKALAEISLKKLEKSFVQSRDNLDAITEVLVNDAEAKLVSASEWYALNLKILSGLLLLGIAGAIVSSLYLIRNVSMKISVLSESLQNSALEISSHVGDLDSTSQTLASAVTEQNSSSHESVAAMEEMSSMVNQTEDSVDRSLSSLNSMGQSIEMGKKVVQSLLESMDKIHKSSEKIVEVEKVIDQIGEKTSIINDIVFKTQLLAFNASIEAARAGQHGRGFSVVAEEVSNLASLSGEAALHIRELLAKSKTQVATLVDETKGVTEEGKEVTDEVGKLFEQIYGEFDSINDSVGIVKHATGEQSLGINQTLQAMNDLNKATQQTSAISSKLEIKSAELSDLHARLESMVAQLTTIVTGQEGSSGSKKSSHKPAMAERHLAKLKQQSREIEAEDFESAA